MPENYQRLKGSLWALGKEKQKLTDKERGILKQLFRYSPDLKPAYTLQTRLTNIFEQCDSIKRAKTHIKNWIAAVEKTGLHCYDRFIKTLHNYGMKS